MPPKPNFHPKLFIIVIKPEEVEIVGFCGRYRQNSKFHDQIFCPFILLFDFPSLLVVSGYPPPVILAVLDWNKFQSCLHLVLRFRTPES